MDSTYIRTWSGFPYVSLIVGDFAHKIVAWHGATGKDVDLVLTPLRTAPLQSQRPTSAMLAQGNRPSVSLEADDTNVSMDCLNDRRELPVRKCEEREVRLVEQVGCCFIRQHPRPQGLSELSVRLPHTSGRARREEVEGGVRGEVTERFSSGVARGACNGNSIHDKKLYAYAHSYNRRPPRSLQERRSSQSQQGGLLVQSRRLAPHVVERPKCEHPTLLQVGDLIGIAHRSQSVGDNHQGDLITQLS